MKMHGGARWAEFLDLVAEPVQVTRELKKLGDQLILYGMPISSLLWNKNLSGDS